MRVLNGNWALKTIALACNLCNDAELYESKGQWLHHGDPMEAALLSFSYKVLGCAQFNVRDRWQRKCAMPFDANSQYMATLSQLSKNILEI